MKRPTRTLNYLPAAGLLFLTEGKRSTGYLLVETTTEGTKGRSFQLAKADGTAYDVLLAGGPDSQCDCPGFTHHGFAIRGGRGCKHLAALAKLIELGRL